MPKALKATDAFNSTTVEEPDYLAIMWIGAGSSFCRDKSKYEAVRRLREQVVSDWGRMFDVYGKEVKFGIFDVQGYEKLWWDHEVHVEGSNEVIPMLEVAVVTLPKKQRDIWSLKKEEVVAAYNDEEDPLGYEPALARLLMLGLTERQADDLLVS